MKSIRQMIVEDIIKQFMEAHEWTHCDEFVLLIEWMKKMEAQK